MFHIFRWIILPHPRSWWPSDECKDNWGLFLMSLHTSISQHPLLSVQWWSQWRHLQWRHLQSQSVSLGLFLFSHSLTERISVSSGALPLTERLCVWFIDWVIRADDLSRFSFMSHYWRPLKTNKHLTQMILNRLYYSEIIWIDSLMRLSCISWSGRWKSNMCLWFLLHTSKLQHLSRSHYWCSL